MRCRSCYLPFRFPRFLASAGLQCIVAVWVVILLGASSPVRAGSILREVFQDVGGGTLADLTNSAAYPNSPTFVETLTDFFEAPTDQFENYGQRIHGYIVPPVSGSYTFWVASDDNGALFLSTDETPAKARQIASVPEWTASREWEKYTSQKSAAITLQANKAYYVAALMKEGGGGDNLAVRWRRPDSVDEGPIPATYLLPWGTAFTPPAITLQPTNTSAVEGQLATFVVKVSNVDPVAVQWKRNTADISGGNSLVLTYGPVSLDDNGASFSATLTNRIGSTNSTAATLQVTPDVTRPVLLAGYNLGADRIRLIFSEPLDPASVQLKDNYSVSGGVGVSAAALGTDPRTVTLTTSPLTFAQNYTVTVRGIQDRARSPNTVEPESTASFLALEFVSQGIGISGGSIVRLRTDAYQVTAAGLGSGNVGDELHYAWEQRSGDFDVRVRVDALQVSDPYVQAGLMARATLETNSPYAAAFTSSAQVGCYFESRPTVGAKPNMLVPRGGFPHNGKQTWLRLQRSGNVLSGFASFDGQLWTSLGSANVPLGSPVFLGLVASSRRADSNTTVRFYDYGVAPSPTVGANSTDREPLGPTTRRTGLVFSEIMYHPRPPEGVTNNLEFVELYNAGPVFEDLSGWRIDGAIQFSFPQGVRLEAGAFVLVSADPLAIQTVYKVPGGLGPFTGSLSNSGERLALHDSFGALKLEARYSPNAPWPVAADGGGHSLVLARPSFGSEDPRAWAASELVGGSPGAHDAIQPTPLRGVVINEFLAHTDDPQLDFIELFNRNRAEILLDGCILTDDPKTNRFRIPAGTRIPGRGHVVFDQDALGFRLNAAGEQIFLISPDGSRVLDAIQFDGQENGVSSGRSPDGADRIRRLVQPTAGAANAAWRTEDIVINEIMYKPISLNDADEFVELYNRSAGTVDLSGWRFTDGIDFEFPSGTVVSPQGFLVVARDAARMKSNYPSLDSSSVFGNFSGGLANGGERLALAKPDDIVSTNRFGDRVTNQIHIVVAEAVYRDADRWHQWADGGGSSLELTDPDSDPLEPSNWADSDESNKAPWTTVSFTGNLDNGNSSYPPNRFQLGLMGAGEALVDDVEFFKSDGVNLVSNGGFEASTGWEFAGNHDRSRLQSGDSFSGARCLRLVSQGDGDTGPNCVRSAITAPPSASGQATIRAKVRWLRGWPEILFRTRGNWIEAYGRMTVPSNLGTPGGVNSRRVANAGPVISQVQHSPLLPSGNQAVVVTARVADPDGLTSVLLRYRTDPSATVSSIPMRDDGTGGDAVAGDGTYTATLAGRGDGTLVAFRVEATDAAIPAANRVFPPAYPDSECLVRWGDPMPNGSFAHYHLWSTAATENARGNSYGLNNRYRDTTMVYGNTRVIYGAGFRDKGSPFHGGYGDIAVIVPHDDLLLGSEDRVLGLTGNGDNEETGMRTQVANWIAFRLGIPHLHSHYIRLFRNGGQMSGVMEDLEQPNNSFAEGFFPSGDTGDLYKIAVWFEFNDDDRGFDARGATLERFNSLGVGLKPARYRWNWQTRGWQGTANNITNIFNLVNAANVTTDYANRMRTVGDIEQWMRVFAFNRICGNWDSWTFSVGQNMYIYFQPGEKAKLLPWDIDFVLGRGNGPTDPLGGGSFGGSSQDPVANALYNDPASRRALFRAYLDAINGPLLPEQYQPQLDSRKAVLQRNGFTVGTSGDLRDPKPIGTYIDARRNYIQSQIAAANRSFAITTSGGNDFTATQPFANLAGTAPFAVADIEVNGVLYPIRWSDQSTFNIVVPLTGVSNILKLVGLDRSGNPVPGASDAITVTYTGAIPKPEDFIVINEIQYDPVQAGASFIELHNRSGNTPFDLSGFVLEGVGYTFPTGASIAPNSFLVLARDRVAFALAYGNTVNVFDEFPGSLDNGGETLSLVKPGATVGSETVISTVRYDDDPPWPASAAGQGPSLQLIDPVLGSWRRANWMATAVGDPNQATPGRVNANRTALDSVPAIWINEVLPVNANGPTDNQGEREPFIEIFNAGPDPVDLTPYFLTDDYGNLTQWAFPAGLAPLGAGQFLVVWADGEPTESTSTAPHTNFRLNASSGSVALVRQQGSPLGGAVLDYVNYDQLPAGRSIGSFPDGDPRKRRSFFKVTAGAANDPAFPPVQVVINEFMASNTRTLTNGVTGRRDDWFELYNAGSSSVDLTGYYLSDTLTNRTQFQIPPGFVLPAGGFLLVWSDEETKANTNGSTQLHANFKLAADGESLALFGPDGVLLDGVTFGAQTADVSLGRFPDGAAGDLSPMEQASPAQANVLAGGNRPPVVPSVPERSVVELQTLRFKVVATDDPGQVLRYSLGVDAPLGASIDEATGDFNWTPTEVEGPGRFVFSLRATDNGTPARTGVTTVTVVVSEQNQAPSIRNLSDLALDERTALAFSVEAEDADLPANHLKFSLEGVVPAGLGLDSSTGLMTWIPTEGQGPGVYPIRVRVTDDGTPPASTTGDFTITVREVNNPPEFSDIQPQSVDEGALFELKTVAQDFDTPPAGILYSLEGTLPDGIRIDSATGVVTWIPQEHQGPANYVILVRATERNPAALSSVRSFSVAVNEVNSRPSLKPIADHSIEEGSTLRIKLSASDADQPAQTLTYGLVGAVPAGVTLDGLSGEFLWNVPPDNGATTNEFVVQVTDSGPGTLSVSTSFRVRVLPKFRVVINEIMYRPGAANAEYVELKNASAVTPWDLSGYRLVGDSLEYTIPAGTTLAPGALLAVSRNLAAFSAAYGSGIRVLGPWSGTLDTAGDFLRLVPPGATPEALSPVRFAASAPWPQAANGSGASLQLIDERRDPARVANWSGAPAYTGPRELVVMTNLWRYYQAGPLDASWKELPFNDTTWPQGRALLYKEEADLPAAKNTPLNLGQNTYYFRTSFQLPSVPAGATLKLTTILDDGAVFYLNGKEIYRQNIPAGTIVDFNTFASPNVADATLTGPFTVSAADLRAGTNVLAVEVHQVGISSSDIVMGCRLDLDGGNLPGLTPGAANNVTAARSEFPPVWINEVLPLNVTGPADRMAEREPWIELVNRGDTDVQLDGWTLGISYLNPGQFQFPVGTLIPAGGFLLVYADGEPAESGAGEIHTNFRLNAGSGVVILSRPASSGIEVADYLEYSGLAGDESWISFPDGQPFQRVRTVLPTPSGTNSTGGGNRPPVLGTVGPQMVSEGELLSFRAQATDPDVGQTQVFSLEGDVQPGMSIHPQTGEFRWVPSEGDGPGIFNIIVRVSDDGVPPAIDEESVQVVVSEVNQKPIVPPLGIQSAAMGQEFTTEIQAMDRDFPAQSLFFSVEGAPAGLSIGGFSGRLVWTPGSADVGTHQFRVKVTDSGTPALSESLDLTIQVSGNSLTVGTEFGTDGSLELRWPSSVGVQYRIEAVDTLDASWSQVGTLPGTGQPMSYKVPTNLPAPRFFRVRSD